MVFNFPEQEEFLFILDFRITLKLPVYPFDYGIVGHDVISLALSETDSENLLLFIKLFSPGLDLFTNNLSIFALGYQKCLPGDDVMIYDLVDVLGCVYCIFVADLRNFIISLILSSISKNKVDWFKLKYSSFISTLTGTI